MGEQEKTSSSRNKQGIVLIVIGIVVFIAGIATATIPGTHLRGSGLGTILIVIGVVMVAMQSSGFVTSAHNESYIDAFKFFFLKICPFSDN